MWWLSSTVQSKDVTYEKCQLPLICTITSKGFLSVEVKVNVDFTLYIWCFQIIIDAIKFSSDVVLKANIR